MKIAQFAAVLTILAVKSGYFLFLILIINAIQVSKKH